MSRYANQIKFITLSLALLLEASSSFGMERQKEDTSEKGRVSRQSLIGQFTTINEGDLFRNESELYTRVYPEILKSKLNEAINQERYLKCDLTDHYAKDLVDLLNRNVSAQEVYECLSICKTINEPGAAEATVRNNLPQGVYFHYLIIQELFESVGVKYRGWDDAETLLIAHKYGVPLRIDPKTKKRIPLVLTPEELERYQAHHDFRVAIHGFYKDYTKLINMQRALKGELPIQDSADDYSKMDISEQPMSFKERQEMMRNAKIKLDAHDREVEQKHAESRARRAAEQAERARQRKEQMRAQELRNLKRAQEKVAAERKQLLEEQAKIQEAQKRLAEQERQNEEKMRAIAEKSELRLKKKEAEVQAHKRQEQAMQLLSDEELARALDQELNGDEALARFLHNQLNG